MIRSIGTAPSVPDIGTVGSPERTMGAEIEVFLGELQTYIDARKLALSGEFANAIDIVADDYVYNGRFIDVGSEVSYGACIANVTLLHRAHPAGWQFMINGNVEDFVSGGVTTIAIATGIITKTAHGKITGDACSFTTTGAFPTGIVAGTVYYIQVIDANTFYICSSRLNSYSGTHKTLSGTQLGTHTIWFEYDETETIEQISGGGLKFKYKADSGDVMVYQCLNEAVGFLSFAGKTFCLEVDIETSNEETYIEIITKSDDSEPTEIGYQKITEIGRRHKAYAYITYSESFSLERIYVGVSVKNGTLLTDGEIDIYSVKFYCSDKPVSTTKEIMEIPVGHIFNTTDLCVYHGGGVPLYRVGAPTLVITDYRRLFATVGNPKYDNILSESAFNFPNTYSETYGKCGYLKMVGTAGNKIGLWETQMIQSHTHVDSGHTHTYTQIKATTGTPYVSTSQTTTTGYANVGDVNTSTTVYEVSSENIHGEHISVGGYVRA